MPVLPLLRGSDACWFYSVETKRYRPDDRAGPRTTVLSCGGRAPHNCTQENHVGRVAV